MPAPARTITFADAVRQFQAGKVKETLRTLEQLAAAGDSRAQDDNVEGAVVLLAQVADSGQVCRAVVAISSGEKSFDRATANYARDWRLQPALKNGEPVESIDRVTIEFSIGEFQVTDP